VCTSIKIISGDILNQLHYLFRGGGTILPAAGVEVFDLKRLNAVIVSLLSFEKAPILYESK
jgi:hypothetical protein